MMESTMMRKIYIYICCFLAPALAVGLGSCDDGELPVGSVAAADAAFVVEGIAAQTRVSYTDYVSSAFEVGDELGACVVEKTDKTTDEGLPFYQFMDGFENVRYRVVESEYEDKYGTVYAHALEPVVPMEVFPVEERYVFYFPYKAGADITNFSHTVLADQNLKEAFQTSDLLRARVNGTDDESVMPSSSLGYSPDNKHQLLKVSMEHVMASIVLKVEKTLVADGSNATLLNVYRSVSGIDLTRTLSKEQQTGAGYPNIPGEDTDRGNIVMWNTGVGSDRDAGYIIYRAVIPGQIVTANSNFLSLTFAGESQEKIYKLNVAGSSAVSFEPTKYYLFTLTKDDGLRFRGIIKDLEDGGDYYYEY